MLIASPFSAAESLMTDLTVKGTLTFGFSPRPIYRYPYPKAIAKGDQDCWFALVPAIQTQRPLRAYWDPSSRSNVRIFSINWRRG